MIEKAVGIEAVAVHRRERVGRLRDLALAWLGDDLDQPLTLEIGCGHGHWLSAYGTLHAAERCIGIDLISKRIEKSNAKVQKRGTGNVTFFKAEAGEFLEALPESVSLSRVFFLFPDPWPKKRHHKRRLIQDRLLSQLAERTIPEGLLFFRTDDRPYFSWTQEHLQHHEQWIIDSEVAWPYEHPTFFQDLLPDYQSLVARRWH